MADIASLSTRFYYSNDMQTSQRAPFIKRDREREIGRAGRTSVVHGDSRNEETLVQSSSATYHRHWQWQRKRERVPLPRTCLNSEWFSIRKFCILSPLCRTMLLRAPLTCEMWVESGDCLWENQLIEREKTYHETENNYRFRQGLRLNSIRKTCRNWNFHMTNDTRDIKRISQPKTKMVRQLRQNFYSVRQLAVDAWMRDTNLPHDWHTLKLLTRNSRKEKMSKVNHQSLQMHNATKYCNVQVADITFTCESTERINMT